MTRNDIDDKKLRDEIGNIITYLNDTSNFASQDNAKKNRHLIILYLATLHPLFKGAGKRKPDKTNNLRYFSGPQLESVQKAIAKKWKTVKIEFDRPRAAETYKSCQNDGYADVNEVTESNIKKRLYALTKEGMKHCQATIESINNTRSDKTTSRNEMIDKIATLESFHSFDEYIERRDVQIIMKKYPTFIGREGEMEKLHSFLNDPTKPILLITGNGGTGKTRLILEFVLRLQDRDYKASVRFINPFKETFSISIPNNTLIILDDAQRQFDKLNDMIDSILNSVIGSKLVLIETPIFFKPIENIIKQKSVKPEVLYLGRGQIVKFLKQNFPWINEHTANNIELDCRDSFDYAAMCAEYYKAGEKVTDLPDIISWKTARYINDIASRNKCSFEDVDYVINLLSMITPIDWDNDRKYFLKEFPNLCDTIEKILYGVRDMYEDSIILPESHSVLLIKPDRLAGFFRLNALQDSKLENALWNLLPYIPMRITLNIRAISDELGTARSKELLYKIWDCLNNNIGSTSEFLKAIMYFTVDISDYFGPMFINSREPNIDNWLKCFDMIYEENPTFNFLFLRNALWKLCEHYVAEQNFILFDSTLGYLDILYKEYSQYAKYNIEYGQYELIQGELMGKIRHSSDSPQPMKLDRYLNKLELLYKKYPDSLFLSYGKLIVEAYRAHTHKHYLRSTKYLDIHIERLRQLYEGNQIIQIAELLIESLTISIRLSSEAKSLDNIVRSIQELRHLYEKYDNDSIREYIGLAVAIAYSVSSSVAHEPCERSNVEILYQEFKHIRERYTAIRFEDLLFFKSVAVPIMRSTDYEIFRTEDGLFVIVLSDKDLPTIDSNDEWIIEENRSIDDHIGLAIGGGRNKLIKLIICPLRLKNDDLLRAMINYIEHTSFHRLADLHTNNAKIGLTNKRGLSILQDPSLDVCQRASLMQRHQCMINVLISEFRSIPIAISFGSILERSRFEEHCSLCMSLMSRKGFVPR